MGPRDRLTALQRQFAIKISRAYRTVSLAAALAIAGLLPIDRRLQEAKLYYEIKRGRPLTQEPEAELETQVPYYNTDHPAKQTPVYYETITDAGAGALQERGIAEPWVYTDGSKIEGKVGAALTVWVIGAETTHRTFRLENLLLRLPGGDAGYSESDRSDREA